MWLPLASVSCRGENMRSAVLIAILLITLPPASVTADTATLPGSVSPAEVKIDGLSPGEPVEFELTIRNEEGPSRVFLLTVYQPSEGTRREGRDELPDGSWVSFSSDEVELGSEEEGSVRVTVSVPDDPAFMGKDWEIWLGVAPQSRELMTVKYYVRLLISTSSEADPWPGDLTVIGIVVAAGLLGYVVYRCSRRRVESRWPPTIAA